MLLLSLKRKQNGSAHMIVVVVLILAVIAGAGAYVATGGFKGKDNKSSDNSSQQNGNPNFKVVKANTTADIQTLLTAVKAGDYDAKCTLDYGDGSASSSLLSVTGKSTLYLSGSSKFRLDTTINHKAGHMMRLGSSMYLWTDGSKEGSKIPITSSSSSSSNYAEKSAIDAAKYKMNCESVAKLDDGLFILPTGVNFVDINSQFKSSSSSN